MIFSMTSDYRRGTGDPDDYLDRIAFAGFTHIHWCHQWNTDFLYGEPEIAHLEQVFRRLGLRLLNLHASHGVEKGVASAKEHERLAGVESVLNRLTMTVRLGGEAVILHAPNEDSPEFRRTLDALEPAFRREKIRLAIENTGGNYPALAGYLRDYAPDVVGICYDSGHANLPEFREYCGEWAGIAGRIYAFHLHDNDGTQDQHRLPFSGTIDWLGVARLIAGSPCRESINLESNMGRYPDVAEDEHLRQALECSRRLAELVRQVEGA